jgi:hypothetical protein
MFGELKSGPDGIMSSPMRWGAYSTIRTSNLKHPPKKLALWNETTKFRCLVIWNWGPCELMRSPCIGGLIPLSKPQMQSIHEKIWLLEPKWLNLDVWWFEIGAPVELWGPPHVGAPIHLQNLKFKTPTNTFALWAKSAKYRCLVIWNRGPCGIMRSLTRWGSNSTFKTLNSKHLPNFFGLWNKTTIFKCLVIWNYGRGGILRSPTHWRANSTFKPSNSKHPWKKLALWENQPNLDVWWFEIGALVELWGPPYNGGSNSTLKT